MWGDDEPDFQLDDEPEEEPEPVDPQDLMRAGLVFYGIMGCVALLWRMWTPGASIFHPSLVAAETAWSPLAAIGAGGFVGLAAIAISEILTCAERATGSGQKQRPRSASLRIGDGFSERQMHVFVKAV